MPEKRQRGRRGGSKGSAAKVGSNMQLKTINKSAKASQETRTPGRPGIGIAATSSIAYRVSLQDSFFLPAWPALPCPALPLLTLSFLCKLLTMPAHGHCASHHNFPGTIRNSFIIFNYDNCRQRRRGSQLLLVESLAEWPVRPEPQKKLGKMMQLTCPLAANGIAHRVQFYGSALRPFKILRFIAHQSSCPPARLPVYLPLATPCCLAQLVQVPSITT